MLAGLPRKEREQMAWGIGKVLIPSRSQVSWNSFPYRLLGSGVIG
jgi:hypothetical protein